MRTKPRSVAPVALGALIALGGCVENRESVTILEMTSPSSDCTADAGGSFISMGRLELAAAGVDLVEYYAFPVVQNNLIPTASELDVERNYIEIIEARVELDFGGLGLGNARFRYPAFKTLQPGESAALQVVAIPSATAQALADALPNAGDSALVRARIKFLYQHGEYERVTHEIEFPILVGTNILIAPPEDIVTCDSGLLPETIRSGNGCNIYQDIGVDCCLSGSSLICPAVDTSSTSTTL